MAEIPELGVEPISTGSRPASRWLIAASTRSRFIEALFVVKTGYRVISWSGKIAPNLLAHPVIAAPVLPGAIVLHPPTIPKSLKTGMRRHVDDFKHIGHRNHRFPSRCQILRSLAGTSNINRESPARCPTNPRYISHLNELSFDLTMTCCRTRAKDTRQHRPGARRSRATSPSYPCTIGDDHRQQATDGAQREIHAAKR